MSGVFHAIAAARAARLLAAAPPEFWLCAACSRSISDPERLPAVRAAAAGVDWDAALRFIARHRIWGRAAEALRAAGVTPPPRAAKRLEARVASMTRRNLALAAETARLQQALTGAGIDALFVKGATLEALVYGDYALKHSLDIDLLVASADALRAGALFESFGYEARPALTNIDPARFALIFASMREWEFHDARGIVAQLHWRLAYNDRLAARFDLGAARQKIDVAGAAVDTLRREELFSYLCVHGAQHSWSRLKWLADLAAVLAMGQGDPQDAEKLLAAAERLGAGRCAAQAFLLAERLLGVAPPSGLAQRRMGLAETALECLALRAMLAGGATDIRPSAIASTLALTLLGEGTGFLASELRRQAISAPDVALVPLPRRFAWLYVVLRLPLWALRRVRRGL